MTQIASLQRFERHAPATCPKPTPSCCPGGAQGFHLPHLPAPGAAPEGQSMATWLVREGPNCDQIADSLLQRRIEPTYLMASSPASSVYIYICIHTLFPFEGIHEKGTGGVDVFLLRSHVASSVEFVELLGPVQKLRANSLGSACLSVLARQVLRAGSTQATPLVFVLEDSGRHRPGWMAILSPKRDAPQPVSCEEKRRVLTAFKLLQGPSGVARLGDWLQRPWAAGNWHPTWQGGALVLPKEWAKCRGFVVTGKHPGASSFFLGNDLGSLWFQLRITRSAEILPSRL